MENRQFYFTKKFKAFIGICLFITVTGSPLSCWSQLTGQNLAEFQFGKIPSDTSNFASIYDRLLLDYDINKFKVGFTLEQYWTPYAERNYIRPNQLRLQYKSDKWDIKLGHMYETLGRGTLMRTYQVPGAILEALSFRSRNYFHRDFSGIYVGYQSDKWSVKALAGQPLNNVFPPKEDNNNRRPDSLAIIGMDYQIKSHKIEYNSLFLTNIQGENLYSMFNFSGNITPILSYYTEFTFDHKNKVIDDDTEYGLYLNLNLNLDRLNVTAEYKNYNNFIIGQAVNEPPALIKQHTYRLLNRSTHVPVPVNETGWQFESSYSFENDDLLTVNISEARNNLGINFVFREFFLEYAKSINEKLDGKVFFDFANDDIKGESNRFSSGFDFDLVLKKRRSLNFEFEYQTFTRFNGRATNMLMSLAYHLGSKYSASLTSEISTDNTLTENGKSSKGWLGGNFKYKPNFKNTFLLFVGTRRGGPACTSGVCYEILDFEGIELRFTRRI